MQKLLRWALLKMEKTPKISLKGVHSKKDAS